MANRKLHISGSIALAALLGCSTGGALVIDSAVPEQLVRLKNGVSSVAVLAPSGTAGDALDDAFFVQGVERSRSYLKRLPGTEAFFFLPSPRRRWTLVHLHGPTHFTAGRSTTP